MAREVPAFLKDFLAMRKSLPKIANPTPVQQAAAPKTKKKSTSQGTLDQLGEMSIAKIIEDKPPKKVVLEYIQKECDRLTAEKL